VDFVWKRTSAELFVFSSDGVMVVCFCFLSTTTIEISLSNLNKLFPANLENCAHIMIDSNNHCNDILTGSVWATGF